MRVEYITKLYQKLESLGLDLPSDCLNTLLGFKEEDLDEILSSNLLLRWGHIKGLLRNYELSCLEEFSNIIKIIANCPLECMESAIYTATTTKIINSGYCKVLTEIVATSKNKTSAECASKAAVSLVNYDFDLVTVTEIVKIIANIKYFENAKQTLKVVTNGAILNSEYLLALTKIIANTKPENVEYASAVALDHNILKSGNIVNLTKIIANAKWENVRHATEVALDDDVLKSGNIINLTKIVANAKPENVEYASTVAMNLDVLKTDYSVELTKIVASAKLGNAEYAYDNAVCKAVLNSGKAIEIVTEIAKAKTPKTAVYASDFINGETINLENIVELVRIIANSKEKNIKIVTSLAEKLIEKEDKVESSTISKLVEIVSQAKEENAAYASYVAEDINVLQSGIAAELTKIFANSKNAYEIYCFVTEREYGKNYNEVYEIAKIIANCNNDKAKFLSGLIVYRELDVKDILLIAKAIENIRLNTNNIAAVTSLIITGNYSKSENPIESLVSILKNRNDYIVFKDAYELDPVNALKGLNDLDRKFKGMDVKDIQECYVKLPKKKKENIK